MTWTILAAANFVGALLSYTLLAYALARWCWSGRGIVLALVAIIISAQVWFIPQLICMFFLGTNVILDGVWFVDWLCCCFSIVLLWNALRDIPPDRASAARIDGCGAFGIYWHVVLPLIRPTLLLLAILSLISNGGYLLARPSDVLRTGSYGPDWLLLAAASLITTAVPIAIFFLARKLFPPRNPGQP